MRPQTPDRHWPGLPCLAGVPPSGARPGCLVLAEACDLHAPAASRCCWCSEQPRKRLLRAGAAGMQHAPSHSSSVPASGQPGFCAGEAWPLSATHVDLHPNPILEGLPNPHYRQGSRLENKPTTAPDLSRRPAPSLVRACNLARPAHRLSPRPPALLPLPLSCCPTSLGRHNTLCLRSQDPAGGPGRETARGANGGPTGAF